MTSPSAMRPWRRGPYAKGRARRLEIIDAALQALAENGHLNTALDEVARRVGITRQGVLHYFGSREDLLIAVLQERDRRDVEAGSRSYRIGEPPADAIERAVLRTRESPGLARLYTSFAAEAADPQHPAHDFFVTRYRDLRGQVRRTIEAAVAAGHIATSVDAEAASQQVLGILDGLQLQWLLDPELDTRAALRDAISRLLPPGRGPGE